MSDKTKSQPNRAIEIYCGGKLLCKAIGNVTISTDRPLTDVLAYGQRYPNATIAGTQTFEISLDIPGAADMTTLYKQLLQSFFADDDLDDIFEAGGIFRAEFPQEDILDNVPIVIIAEGLDARLLETGTPVTDLIIPFIAEAYFGCTLRQLLSVVDLGENHYRRNLTLKPIERRVFNGPIAIDMFNLGDKEDLSGIECAFQLTDTPLKLIDGQYCVVMVDNQIWRKGYYYDAGAGVIIFDEANGYCPGNPTALFLREEHTIGALGVVNLDNEPMANGIVITNEFDTEKYIEVGAAPAEGEYTIAAAVATFNVIEIGDVIHATYFHQSANVPFKNITIIYVTSSPGIKAGDPFFPMSGDLSS